MTRIPIHYLISVTNVIDVPDLKLSLSFGAALTPSRSIERQVD